MFKALGDSLGHLFDNSWVKAAVPLLSLLAGWYGKRLLDRLRWRKKQFLHRMLVSLNSLHDGKLLLRTVFERSLQEVFLNGYAVSIVADAAERTAAAQPLLPLPKDETWHILTAVLNAIAEEFHAGPVARDLGLPTVAGIYLFCLTHEKAEDVKQSKVRVQLIREDVLRCLPKEPPQFDSPHHATRFETLQAMAKAHAEGSPLVRRIELVLPA